MIDREYFVGKEDVNLFLDIMQEWDNIVHNFKSNKSDKEIQEKLQKVIEKHKKENKLPRLSSITKNKPNDHMALKEIKYVSSKKEFTLTVVFESPLKTSATVENTYTSKG